MSYQILIERRAERSLSKIVNPARDRIIQAIRSLAKQPRPPGARKLTGREAWRVRVGSFRVIYEIHDPQLLVLVIDVGDRKEVYRT
ncbi:MAG: type II toxin-antitoxin system RelE/ParE family toxin [Verrucomicrobiae bacterium]|nr:type II toxin-antitoxin system RelE/ParE family toxin [Verrucomicrobiae bacterium]